METFEQLPARHDALSSAAFRRFLIGQSPSMLQLCDVIQLIASRRVTVLVSGETGTGKEVIARAIHAASNRASSPLVAVNCTALPANLVESELFGHVRGAFTGADRPRIGRFEQAHRGTIFLDEIGDLPLESQGKLLRVLQEQEFERVGSSETVRVDVRVIAATNVPLEAAVKERRFREDLFYRLNVVPIYLPPLRERRQDIPLLLEHFLEKIRGAEMAQPKTVSAEVLAYLLEHPWPGNVRQLEHTIQRAFALSGNRPVIELSDLATGPVLVSQSGQSNGDVKATESRQSGATVRVSVDGLDFDEVVSNLERSLLQQALLLSGGNKARAADLLRIKRTTLLAKMKTLDERKAQDDRRAAAQMAATAIRPALQPERVTASANRGLALIAEPAGEIRKLIARVMTRAGYRTLESPDQESAQELFECWGGQVKVIVAHHECISALRAQLPMTPAIQLVNPSEAAALPDSPALTEVLSLPCSQEDLTVCLERLARRPSPALSGVACA